MFRSWYIYQWQLTNRQQNQGYNIHVDAQLGAPKGYRVDSVSSPANQANEPTLNWSILEETRILR